MKAEKEVDPLHLLRFNQLMSHFGAKTPTELARMTNANQSDLSKIARGLSNIGATTAYRLVKTDRRLSIFWIIDGEGEMLIPDQQVKKYCDVGQDTGMVKEPDTIEVKMQELEARLERAEQMLKAYNQSHLK